MSYYMVGQVEPCRVDTVDVKFHACVITCALNNCCPLSFSNVPLKR